MYDEVGKLQAELTAEKLYSSQAQQTVNEIAAERDALAKKVEVLRDEIQNLGLARSIGELERMVDAALEATE